jgi:hypothetical protein
MSGNLVTLETIERDNSRSRAARTNANFVAHLIATRAQAPQTRARRRADPAQAIRAYNALGQWPIRPGRSVLRVVVA